MRATRGTTATLPVGWLVGAAAQVDGELGHVRVGAGQQGQQLHKIHSPDVAVRATMHALLQAEACHRGLQTWGQGHRHHRGGLETHGDTLLSIT